MEPRGAGVGGAPLAPRRARVGAGVSASHVIEHQTEVLGRPQVTGQPGSTLLRDSHWRPAIRRPDQNRPGAGQLSGDTKVEHPPP